MGGFKPMNSAQVIAHYERLSTLTGQMLEAAKSEEWDTLISVEQQCSELVAAIKPLDAEVALDEAACQHKKHLINNILADDTEIRLRVQEWMRQLQLSMQSNRQEQRLLQAYGA
jgi:flagellar protein FliT